MSESPGRVVVAGGGVFGAAASLALRRRGWSVTLVERVRGPHPEASSTDASKMIRMDYGADVFYHELAEASLEGWERWNRDWPRPLYHGEGFLVLSGGPMRPGGFEYESHRVLNERGYRPEWMGGARLARSCPAWNGDRYPDGYLSPRAGWAEGAAVVSRLLELGEEAGVEVAEGRVTTLVDGGSTVTGVVLEPSDGADAYTIEADRVVLCLGAWTPSLVPELAGALRCVAQPILHFRTDRPDDFRGPSFPPFAADIAGTGWYGFPADAEGRVKLGHHGPGEEVTPDEPGQVDEAHMARARAFLQESLPGLAEAPIVDPRICTYCDSFDGDLLIDRDPQREGVIVATGGSGHGFKFAPELGSIIADATEGRDSRWAARFRWRTSGEPATEAARLKTP